MLESYVERKVKDWARKQGILVLKLTPYATSGYPDDIFLYKGLVTFIEFKAPGKKPRLLQEIRMRELKERGFNVAVIDSISEGLAFLEATLLSANRC